MMSPGGSRYGTRHEKPEPSFFDTVINVEKWGQIAQSFGFSYDQDTATATDESRVFFGEEDSRNDTSDDESYRSSKKASQSCMRVDADGEDVEQQNLQKIYNQQKEEQKKAYFNSIETADGSLYSLSDDESISARSLDSEYYSIACSHSGSDKPLTSCLRPGSVLKDKTKTTKKSKKITILLKKSAAVEPVEEKKQVRWLDQFVPNLAPVFCGGLDEHGLVMERMMSNKHGGIPVFCGGLAEM